MESMEKVCPQCQHRNDPASLICVNCGADLEVTAVAPSLALALAPQEAEDWGE